ncbi:MAG: ribonuclease HII, partial [Bacilli bacterium]|nr:ribonuclease HII [Bacilli bacterium]
MSSLKEFDDRLRENHGDFIAGFDEAGRGPLCGPVVAAGVILPPGFDSSIINDSKKLTDKKRREMF